jgi:probable HAF family extracellular repeat protein
VGDSLTPQVYWHCFRTAPNSPINLATDDLGTFGGGYCSAQGINASGQVVGAASTPGEIEVHAFRTAPNSAINLSTDDLGTLGGTNSWATAINASGQVVGVSSTGVDPIHHAFLYSDHVMHDLNNLIPAGSNWVITDAMAINDTGQIVGWGYYNGELYVRAVLLTPITPYRALVQQPINADDSSVFKANRGTVPVKFRLTQNDTPTCSLPPATISVTRTAGGTLGSIDESTYSMAADNGSNFRIDPTACQYVYNLAASSLGVGTYRVDVRINGTVVGNAVFALK